MQKNGSLKATDFFSIHDDAKADEDDWDMSGSPVLLPTELSTPKHPHLLVATGKEGIVYLLDADNLGGHNEGPGGRDDVVGEYGQTDRRYRRPVSGPVTVATSTSRRFRARAATPVQ